MLAFKFSSGMSFATSLACVTTAAMESKAASTDARPAEPDTKPATPPLAGESAAATLTTGMAKARDRIREVKILGRQDPSF